MGKSCLVILVLEPYPGYGIYGSHGWLRHFLDCLTSPVKITSWLSWWHYSTVWQYDLIHRIILIDLIYLDGWPARSRSVIAWNCSWESWFLSYWAIIFDNRVRGDLRLWYSSLTISVLLLLPLLLTFWTNLKKHRLWKWETIVKSLTANITCVGTVGGATTACSDTLLLYMSHKYSANFGSNIHAQTNSVSSCIQLFCQK